MLLAALLWAHPAVPDTIYSLAVDSTKYRDEPFVYLLDDGVLRYEADGRGSTTYHQVVQILKEDAVGRWAELAFGYEPRHQKLTVNWVRVVSLTGEVLADKPGISQDADIPAPMGDPAYEERKSGGFHSLTCGRAPWSTIATLPRSCSPSEPAISFPPGA